MPTVLISTLSREMEALYVSYAEVPLVQEGCFVPEMPVTDDLKGASFRANFATVRTTTILDAGHLYLGA